MLEYLWKAAWCFYAEGDPAVEAWVQDKARAILAGRAAKVAGAIRRQATNAKLEPTRSTGADTCARYLTNKAPYLDYPTALTSGWPIATGVIEGACGHLVKDRLDITGARWGLPGAEAILKLRAVRSNGDSTPTGTTTSPRNSSAPTAHATPTTSSRRRHDVPPEVPHHPYYWTVNAEPLAPPSPWSSGLVPVKGDTVTQPCTECHVANPLSADAQ